MFSSSHSSQKYLNSWSVLAEFPFNCPSDSINCLCWAYSPISWCFAFRSRARNCRPPIHQRAVRKTEQTASEGPVPFPSPFSRILPRSLIEQPREGQWKERYARVPLTVQVPGGSVHNPRPLPGNPAFFFFYTLVSSSWTSFTIKKRDWTAFSRSHWVIS